MRKSATILTRKRTDSSPSSAKYTSGMRSDSIVSPPTRIDAYVRRRRMVDGPLSRRPAADRRRWRQTKKNVGYATKIVAIAQRIDSSVVRRDQSLSLAGSGQWRLTNPNTMTTSAHTHE